MADKVVTLEINSTGIRLMEIEGQRVTRWASHPLEPAMFDGEVITNPQAFGASVKQLVNSSGINARNITASISSLYSLSRIVTIPSPTGVPVTKQTVMEAIKDIMPLSEEESYLSWQTLATVANGQRVLVVGVPKDMIDSEVRALRAVNINPRLLELKTLALVRAVDREQALILNIESSSFDMVMVVGGITEVMFTTVWQSGDFSLEEKAEHLVVALELTVGFYNSHHPDLSLDPTTPLFITGQMSGDSALLRELQTRVGYTIETPKPPLEYPEHFPVSQYAVNIGLALKGAALSKNPGSDYSPSRMNFLPQIYRPWKASLKQIYISLAIVAAIALVFPLYNLTTEAMNQTDTLKARYTAFKNELQRRQLELAKRVPLEAVIKEYKTIIDMGGGFTEDIQVVRTEADKLDIRLDSITHQGGLISVSLEANTYIAFRDYITALEANGRFASITRPPEQYSYVKSGTLTLVPKSGR